MDKKINITQLFMKEYVTTFENQFVVQSIQQYYKLSHFVLRDYSEAPLSITLNLNSNSASFKHISFIYYSLGDYNQHKKEAEQLLSNLIQPKHKGNLQHPSKVHVLINFSETSPRMVNIVHLLDMYLCPNSELIARKPIRPSLRLPKRRCRDCRISTRDQQRSIRRLWPSSTNALTYSTLKLTRNRYSIWSIFQWQISPMTS